MAKKMGRPPVADHLRRAECFTIRLRPADKRAVLRAAHQAGQPPRVWTREVVLRAARRAGASG